MRPAPNTGAANVTSGNKPEPGTKAYYDRNQVSLAVFLFIFAKGYRTAWNARGEPLPESIFASRHAAMMLLNPDEAPEKILSYFGEIALPPITVSKPDGQTREDFTETLGLTERDIAILRDYYLLSDKGRQLWRAPMIAHRYRKLLKRVPAQPATGADAPRPL
jgi:hypothetical protein